MERSKDISARKYLKSNAKASIVRVGISTIATLVIIPFIIKSIGMEKYSYISVTSFLVSFSAIFDLGFSRSLVYLVNEKDITEKRRNQYITAIKLVNLIIMTALLLFGSLALICKWNILGDSIPPNDGYYLLVAICALIVMFLSIYNMFQNALLEGFFLLDYSANGVTLKIIVTNFLYLVNLLTINHLPFYVATPVIACVVSSIYYKVIIKQKIVYKTEYPTRSIIRTVVKQAYSFFKTGILTSINSVLPRLAIIYLTPNISYVGILDVITKITTSIINLFSTISRPFLALSRVNAQKIRNNFKNILFIYSSFGIVFWVGIYLFRNMLVDYFFRNTEAGIDIANVLLTYSAASLFFLIGQPFSLYLQGIGKNNKLARIMFGNILIFVVAFIVMDILEIHILLNLAIANIMIAIFYTSILLFESNKPYYK